MTEKEIINYIEKTKKHIKHKDEFLNLEFHYTCDKIVNVCIRKVRSKGKIELINEFPIENKYSFLNIATDCKFASHSYPIRMETRVDKVSLLVDEFFYLVFDKEYMAELVKKSKKSFFKSSVPLDASFNDKMGVLEDLINNDIEYDHYELLESYDRQDDLKEILDNINSSPLSFDKIYKILHKAQAKIESGGMIEVKFYVDSVNVTRITFCKVAKPVPPININKKNGESHKYFKKVPILLSKNTDLFLMSEFVRQYLIRILNLHILSRYEESYKYTNFTMSNSQYIDHCIKMDIQNVINVEFIKRNYHLEITLSTS
jgi:hypothetical protein